MDYAFKLEFDKVNGLISKKKEEFLLNYINNALNVIHEAEYCKILNYLKDNGINLNYISDLPDRENKIRVYYIKKGTIIESHTHKFKESYICLFGKMKISVLNKISYINSFDTFKVDKYQSHSIEILEDTILIVFI